MGKENIRKKYEEACNSYVKAMLKEWHLTTPNIDSYWIGGDVGGIYEIIDLCYLTMDEIRYIVDNSINMDVVLKWVDYNLRCFNIGLEKINLKSWCENAPRYSESTIKNLEEKTKELNDMIKWADMEQKKDLKQ